MKIYNYDPITYSFTGESVADESPLEPGVFLIPAHATTKKPPSISYPKHAVWRNEKWKVEQIPVPKEETITEAPELVEPEYQFQDFLNALLAGVFYQKILTQSVSSPAVNTAFTSLMLALVLATSVRTPNAGAIQSGFENLLGAMETTPEDIATLEILLDKYKLTGLVTLPDQTPSSN